MAFVEVFLDQVDEFFSDVGLDFQVVWWIEPEDIALTVPFPFAVLLGGFVLEGCVWFKNYKKIIKKIKIL